jgi:hypothetical protein
MEILGAISVCLLEQLRAVLCTWTCVTYYRIQRNANSWSATCFQTHIMTSCFKDDLKGLMADRLQRARAGFLLFAKSYST